MAGKTYDTATLPLNPELAPLMEFMEKANYAARRELLRRFTPTPMAPYLYKYRALVPGALLSTRSYAFTERSIEGLRDILVGSVLRLNPPESFNDPFEFAAKLSVAATEEQRIAKFAALADERSLAGDERRNFMQMFVSATEERLLETFRNSHEGIRKTAGVYCFAGTASSTLMWSHYAHNHTGVCLQFDRARDFSVLGHAVPVDYERDFPVANWIADAQEGIKEMLTRKDPCWKYEEEHRILAIDQAGKYLQIRPDALTAIIIGCKAGAQVISAIEELVAERLAIGLPDVPRLKAAMHDSRYEVVVAGLPD